MTSPFYFIMDDTIKTNDSDFVTDTAFKGYNPEISYTGENFVFTLADDNETINIKKEPVYMSNGFWKYEEDKTLKDVEQYLSSTYHSHYTSEQSKTQTLDLIESIGDAEAFTRSNAIKYLSRFGKKHGKSKMDILKAIHYCILLYHFAGLHKNKTDQYNY